MSRHLSERARALLLSGLLVATIPLAIAGPAGTPLDPQFGAGGLVVTSYLPLHDTSDLVRRGHRIFQGVLVSGTQPSVLEFDPDGKLLARRMNTPFPHLADEPRMVELGDGSLLLAGMDGTQLSASRFSTNSVLSVGPSLAIEPATTGLFPLFGLAADASHVVFAYTTGTLTRLRRFNTETPSLVPDATFGNDGVVEWGADANSELLVPADVAIDAAGRIWLGGRTRTSPLDTRDFFVARLLPEGSLDPGFGENGVSRLPLQGRGFGRRIALLPDGGVALAGMREKAGGVSSVAVVQLRDDGSLDTEFGENGISLAPLGRNFVRSLVLDGSGRLLVAGAVRLGGDLVPFLLRLNPDGSPDIGFGSDGVMTPDLLDSPERRSADISGLLLEDDGSMLIGGRLVTEIPDQDDRLPHRTYVARVRLDH